MNLKDWYTLIRIVAGDERKRAFRIKQRLFVFAVIPLGLTCAPASFLELMDTIFKNKEVYIWYLDNILICSGDTEGEHQDIVENVLQ